MSSPGAPGDDTNNNVPLDPVLVAIQAIRDITSKPGNKLLKADANTIAGHNLIIETHYLALVDKIKELELIKQSYVKSKQQTSQSPTTSKSYSAAVAGPTLASRPVIDPRRTIQVYPKLADTGEPVLNSPEATKQLLQMIDLKDKTIGIEHMKSIRCNGVSILCRNQDDAKKLTEIITTQQTANLEVKTPVQRNPTFTFLLRGKDVDLDDLKTDLISKNACLRGEKCFKLVHKYATKAGNTIVVIEVQPETYKALKANDFKLYGHWTRVVLREQQPITQCFNCMRFGHKAKGCLYMINKVPAKRCSHCSDDHSKDTDCSLTQPCCSNCKDFNVFASKRKWKLIDTKHDATDTTCPMRTKAVERARSLVNYG